MAVSPLIPWKVIFPAATLKCYASFREGRWLFIYHKKTIIMSWRNVAWEENAKQKKHPSRQSVSVAEKSWKKHPTEDFPISIHYLILDPWFVLEIARGWIGDSTIENRARDPKVERWLIFKVKIRHMWTPIWGNDYFIRPTLEDIATRVL